jgi:hypothetical protein
MAKKKILLGMLAFALTFGMSLTLLSCDDGGDDTSNSTDITGTWEASGERVIVFTGNTFTYTVNGTIEYSGTFSTSGSTITFTVSQGSASGNFQLSGGSLFLSNHTWDNSIDGTYTKSDSSSGTTYMVSYNSGEGTGTAPSSQTVASGTSITLPAIGSMTAPTGKTFDGWITGGLSYAAGASYPVTGNVTFTAKWTTTSTPVTKPSAPTGVTVSNEGSLSLPNIVIRWDNVSDATSYKVYRATSASGDYQSLGSSTTYNSAVDSNPLTGTSYYKVKAVNSSGESEYSNYASLSYDPSAVEPGTPTISGSTSGNNITLSWSFPTGAGSGTPTSIDVKVMDPSTGSVYTLDTLSGTATKYTFNYLLFVDTEYDNVKMAITGKNSYGSATSRTIIYMPKANKWY